MGKKVHFISKIQQALDTITNGTAELNDLAYACEDKELQDILFAYVAQYAHLNYTISVMLIEKLMKAVRDDKDEDDFNKLMEGLK